MCNYLLLRKNFDLILIHKGGTGKTGSFQLAQLFAQLLGLLQNGDIVAAAQVCSLGKNGGEVGIEFLKLVLEVLAYASAQAIYVPGYKLHFW